MVSEKRWTPEQVLEEYERGIRFKNGLGSRGLYEQNRINERFYLGDQWHGVRCGEDRPLVRHNVIKRIGDTSGAFERYTNTYSDEKSQRRLSWYTWDFSDIGADFSYLMARDDSAVLLGSVGETGGAFDAAFTLGGEADSLVQVAGDNSSSAVGITTGAIACSFATKWFSFDGKETKKTISRLLLELGEDI